MNGTGVLAAVNWTDVLLYGIPAYIAATGSAVAAVISANNRRSLRTSNGQTIAQAVEATHAAVTEGVETVHKISDTQDNEILGGTHV